MDEMLTEFLRVYKLSDSLQAIAPYYRSMMKLLLSNRDRSIVHWILKQVYSSTSSEHYLAIDRDTLNDNAKEIKTALQSVDTAVEKLSVKADHHINEKNISLKSSIEKDSSLLERKRMRLFKELIEDKEFDPINKQFVYYKFNQWKSKIKSQLGKKRGSFLIDRRAEEAIFGAVAEHAKSTQKKTWRRGHWTH